LKVTRILVVLALAGFLASAALGDGLDPTVVVRRVDPPPIAITSPTETFDIFATAKHNIFAFQNDTGITLTSLTLDLFAGTSGLIYSCGSFAGGGVFADCTATAEPGGDTLISFFGVGGDDTGITPATCTTDDKGKGDDKWDGIKDSKNNDDKTECTGGIYSLEFGGIPKGAVVRGTGSFVTPEPATAVMLFGGLVSLAGLRKRRVS
jgi:hypothetical protein